MAREQSPRRWEWWTSLIVALWLPPAMVGWSIFRLTRTRPKERLAWGFLLVLSTLLTIGLTSIVVRNHALR